MDASIAYTHTHIHIHTHIRRTYENKIIRICISVTHFNYYFIIQFFETQVISFIIISHIPKKLEKKNFFNNSVLAAIFLYTCKDICEDNETHNFSHWCLSYLVRKIVHFQWMWWNFWQLPHFIIIIILRYKDKHS